MYLTNLVAIAPCIFSRSDSAFIEPPSLLRSKSGQVAIRFTALGWSKSQQRERGYLPDGTRHDKATVWEFPALPHLSEPLPHPLPHPTARQS